MSPLPFLLCLVLLSLASSLCPPTGPSSSCSPPPASTPPARRGVLGKLAFGLASLSSIRPSFAAETTTSPSGLKSQIITPGTGTPPPPGTSIKAQYTGWLDGFDGSKKFDSSRDRGRPFSFKVGAGQVIKGWDEAFLEMKIGERRLIEIPPALGYGDRGAGGVIPGGATLFFDVELVSY